MNNVVPLVTRLTLVALVVLAASHVLAQDAADSSAESQSSTSVDGTTTNVGPSIQLKTTSVTGSRELPKVLVIVPWKTSEALGPGERPLASLVEEALTPVDPDVFRRQLDYYTSLKEASANNGKGDSNQ